jgi:outer membrane immunogenic protein
MKKNVLVAALLSVAASGVMAQSVFNGAYGQVGIGYESVTPSISPGNLKVTGSGPLVGSYPISASMSNANSFSGAVGLGYNYTVTKDFLLGIGAEYNPITSQSANFSGSISKLGNGSGTWKKDNSYNIFISPATPIGQDGLLYGKVGYTGATIKGSGNGTSSTNNLTGYSLGAGYKQIITGGIYGFGEVNYASYGNSTISKSTSVSTYTVSQSSTLSANSFNVMLGVGYKF